MQYLKCWYRSANFRCILPLSTVCFLISSLDLMPKYFKYAYYIKFKYNPPWQQIWTRCSVKITVLRFLTILLLTTRLFFWPHLKLVGAPRPGIDPRHPVIQAPSDPRHSSDDTGSLTHWTKRELQTRLFKYC